MPQRAASCSLGSIPDNLLKAVMRYAAIELTGAKRDAAFQNLESVPMYEELVETGAWWDYVDVIASRRLGPLLKRHPTSMRRKKLSWSRSENIWKRRAAIVCQPSG